MEKRSTVVSKKENPITKEKEWRVCKDYRQINAISHQETWPITNIDTELKKLSQYKYYTGIDVKSAYYHIPVEKESQGILAFAIGDNQRYKPTRMPFGPRSAAKFAAVMQTIFRPLREENWVQQYFDDLTIGANSIQEMKERVVRVLRLCQEKGLQIKLTKCEWMKEEIEILGQTVSKGRIGIQKRKIDKIKEWQRPKYDMAGDLKTIEAFLGLVNYVRKVIPGIAEYTSVISEVAHKK